MPGIHNRSAYPRTNEDESGTPLDHSTNIVVHETDSYWGESSPLVELRPEEFSSYFTERGDRLFHSNSSLYPLPVDTPEQERNTFLHDVLLQFHGSNYIGPVPEILAMNIGHQNRVLDVCTGNGIWVLEMAREFPLVDFVGFDHVPITTRLPPENVQFHVMDVNGPFHWSGGSFDVVHARGINLAVHDYHVAMEEISRVLRPGGLFISREWGQSVAFPQSWEGGLSTHAPACSRFLDAVNSVLTSRRAPYPLEVDVALLLSGSRNFVDITAVSYYIPIGSWSSDASLRHIGEINLKAQERYAESVRHLFIEAAWEESDIDLLLTDYVEEIRRVDGLLTVCYTVHARKA